MPERNLFLKDTLSPEAVTEPMNSIFSDTDVLAWFESLVLFFFFLFFRSIEELLEAKTENKKKWREDGVKPSASPVRISLNT